MKKSLFKRPKNKLEDNGKIPQTEVNIPKEICDVCPSCKQTILMSSLKDEMYLCPYCGEHFKMPVRYRIQQFADKDSFVEFDKNLESENIIEFDGYEAKLQNMHQITKENEAVVTGKCSIDGIDTCIFVMNSEFMMGSMGQVVGEKITRLFEYAKKERLPVIGICVSGGARMQEGTVSLMQMAKTSMAVKKHAQEGLLYISLLTNPTTGGVLASFASLADIILAEPNALVGFAGPRVIEQTIKTKLPKGFQRAEMVLETGFIDNIVDRRVQRTYISNILKLHS